MAQTDAAFRGPDEVVAERVFRSEWHNFRAAFQTACELGSPDDAGMLLRHACVWGCGRTVREVGMWAERVAHLPLRPTLSVVATSVRMVFAVMDGERRAAGALRDQALAEDAALGGTGEPWAHWCAIWPTFTWSDAIAAAVALEARAGITGDAFWITQGATTHAQMLALSFQTHASDDSGTRADFTALASRALALAEALGRPASIGRAMSYLGIALAHSSDSAGGRDLLTRSMELGRQSHNSQLVLAGHVELIWLEASLDDIDAVVAHIAAVVASAEPAAVACGDRRHLMRFAAEAIGATILGVDEPAGVAALRERIVRVIGPEEYARRVAAGQADGTAGAANHLHYHTPW